MLTLQDLAIEHPYYCSSSNWYSNEAAQHYETMREFLNEWSNYDVDLNLCFRWDVRKNEDDDGYCCEVFIMLQRKGKFTPVLIDSIKEEDVADFVAYLKPHIEKLQQMWLPLSFNAEK